jgi:hypothetical protein
LEALGSRDRGRETKAAARVRPELNISGLP